MIKRESVLRKEFILIENIWHCKDRVLDQVYFYFASKLISQKHIFNGKRRELLKIIIKNFSQSFYFLSLLCTNKTFIYNYYPYNERNIKDLPSGGDTQVFY